MKTLIFPIALMLFSHVATAQVSGSFYFEGLNRDYLTYVPASIASGTPAPLVFVLHGFTQTAQGVMQYSNFNEVAESEGFIVVYPNGVNLSWNVGFSSSGVNDVGFLNALIDTLDNKYPVNLDRVYACGMSNGGFMSYLLACELGHRITAIASVAGSMTSFNFNDCHPKRAVPVMEIHGTSDLIVNYNGATGIKSIAEVIAYWVAQNGCPSQPQVTMLPDLENEGSRIERMTYEPCANNGEVTLLKVINGGHTWPGSSDSGFGNTNRDIHASREIWNFFNQFNLSGIINATDEARQSIEIAAFPNPAAEILQVSLPQDLSLRNAALRLLDAQGRAVLQQALSTPTIQLSVSALPAGMYVLEVWTAEGIAHKKVLIH